MDILKKFVAVVLILSLFNFLFVNNVQAIYLKKPTQDPYKDEFVGKWKMQTIVTDSKCPYILVGSTTESNLEIKLSLQKKLNSFLKVLWRGGNWEESKGTIKFLSDKEAITERLTHMKTRDNNKWKAILIDHFYLKDKDVIHSESIVTQYKNNVPVGEYKTFSILTKAE